MDLVLLAVAVLAVSTSAPLVREAAAPALVIAFWRNALAAGLIVPSALVGRRAEIGRLDRREQRLLGLSGVVLAAHFATWIPSLSYTTVASSVALVSTQPVWSALMAKALGDRVGRRSWTGIAVALAGVLVLTGADVSVSGRALFGDALALAGGILAAAYVTVGASTRRTVSTTVYTAGCYSVAAVLLLGMCIVSGRALVSYPARTWWSLAAITVGPQLLGHTVLNRLLRTTTATVVSVALLFEMVGATLLARWWFGEAPPDGVYPAALLIGAGVWLVVRDSPRVRPQEP